MPYKERVYNSTRRLPWGPSQFSALLYAEIAKANPQLHLLPLSIADRYGWISCHATNSES